MYFRIIRLWIIRPPYESLFANPLTLEQDLHGCLMTENPTVYEDENVISESSAYVDPSNGLRVSDSAVCCYRTV
jgi:hypothetical protein